MILEALCQYYRRLDADPEKTAAAPGYAAANVSSCITLDREGRVTGVLSFVEGKSSKKMIAPQQPKRSGQRPEAAFLCENREFLFGIYKDQRGADYRFEASRDKHEEVLARVDDAGARAVLKFFALRQPGGYDYGDVDMSALDAGGNIIFRLEGESGYLHERPAIQAAWARYRQAKSEERPEGQCLVTGDTAPIAALHGNFGGFGQDKPTLVGFNQEAFVSYHKVQGENAPVSETAAFQYVTALNALLADKNHVVNLAGDKVVFWAEREAKLEEDAICASLGGQIEDQPEDEESVDSPAVRQINGILESLYSGKRPFELGLDENVRFYILGISANKTRMVVRFFYANTFGRLIDRLMRHYHDIDLVAPAWESRLHLVSPYRILRETAVRRERSNIPRSMESGLFRNILWGTPYSYALYTAMLNRIRAEAGSEGSLRAINRIRVGIVKGYLNRMAEMNHSEEMMTVGLNEDETNKGYLMGQLFAVLEKAQNDALGHVNASIVDKYLNSALAAPQSVFPVLLPLFEKHVSKSGKYYTKVLVQRIMERISSEGFPRTLNMEDQGRFLVGYYHQRQSLYTPKDEKEKAAETEAAERQDLMRDLSDNEGGDQQ
jgi:CRISPR-associated protein Csd1